MKTLPLYPKSKRVLTPAEYVKLSKEELSKIKSVKIIPPKLGHWSFGKILVEYKRPIYEMKLKDAS